MMKKYVLAVLILLFYSSTALGQNQSQPSKWDNILDVAYLLTYGDSGHIEKEISKFETEFGENLSTYVDNGINRLATHEKSGNRNRLGGDLYFYSEDFYKRLAIAELLLYLTSRDKERLNEAVRMLKYLNIKLEKPEIAYWYYYIQAYDSIELYKSNQREGSEQFTRNVFKIWLDVILKLEELQDTLKIPKIKIFDVNKLSDSFISSLPFLYENIANLVLDRAIIENQINNLEALGSIIWLLEQRMTDPDGYISEIEIITKRIHGPKSDVYRLNYTVNYLEAERDRKLAQKEILDNGISGPAETLFFKSRKYYNLAYENARTRQGQAAAITDYLNMVSFAISKFPEKGRFNENSLFSTLPAHAGALTIEKAVNLFDELAAPGISTGGWAGQGFPDKKTYIAAMHDLWRSITELSYWTAEYYLNELMNSGKNADMFDKAPPAQAELLLMLDFFERYLKEGYVDIVPENAYINTSIAAAKLSNIYLLIAPYSTDMTNYNLAFGRLLQYVEMYPFNPEAILELAKRLNEVGTQRLYVQYVLPLAEQIRNSRAIKDWIDVNKDQSLTPELEKLYAVIPEFILMANTIIYLRDMGEESIKTNIETELKSIEEKSSGYLEKEINFDYSNFGDLNDKLQTLIDDLYNTNVQSNESMRHKDISALVSKAMVLKEKLRDLDEASRLLSDLQTYQEMNEKIIEELNRKISHPAHTLLRTFFHEKSLSYKYYYRFLRYKKFDITVSRQLLKNGAGASD